MNDKVPHRLLHGFRTLLVDKAVRQKQHRSVARVLRAEKPLQEGDTIPDFERRICDDVLAAEADLMELHPQRGSFGVEAFVKTDQLRIGIEAEDRRRMHAFEDQGVRKLPRSAAGVHDTAVIVEISHGQRRHLAGRTVGCQVLRGIDTLAALSHIASYGQLSPP